MFYVQMKLQKSWITVLSAVGHDPSEIAMEILRLLFRLFDVLNISWFRVYICRLPFQSIPDIFHRMLLWTNTCSKNCSVVNLLQLRSTWVVRRMVLNYHSAVLDVNRFEKKMKLQPADGSHQHNLWHSRLRVRLLHKPPHNNVYRWGVVNSYVSSSGCAIKPHR